jgi:N-acyl-D-amino-acid deacylase
VTALDLLFRDALLVDGTGGAPYRGDVGVRDGRIAALGAVPPDAPAARVLDAGALALAPGFIDVHTHSDVSLLLDPAGESKLYQGVTTEVVGNCSFSAFPVDPRRADLHHEHLEGIQQAPPRATWTDLDGYAQALERRGTALHIAPLAGHGALRIAAMGLREGPARGADLERLRGLVAESLEQGALGISTGLTYVPSMYGSTDELVALCEVVAAYGGVYATHARANAGAGEFAAVEEAIEIGRRSGARVEFSHLAINDPRNWGRGHELLALFDAAVAEGVDIGFDVYPYDASSSALTQYLPAWVQAGGHKAMTERLRDAQVRRQALADLAAGWAGGIPWHWDRVTICQAPPESQQHIGRTLAEIALDEGTDPAAVTLDLCARHGNAVKVVLHYRTEADMLAFLRHPLALVGSDGNAIPEDQRGDRPHPRHFGCFPRVLGRYVRDQRALGLAEAVHKMTGKTAAWLGMRDRGRLAKGLVADLVAFDPEHVADRATFLDPCRLAAGVTHVVVAGELVLDGGVQTAARPGRVLRRPSDSGG